VTHNVQLRRSVDFGSLVANPRVLLLENLGREEICDRSGVGYDGECTGCYSLSDADTKLLTAFVGAILNGDFRGRSGKVLSIPCIRPPESASVWLSS
jgi:hypothetical protein